jgi:hypothetical protein
MRHQQAALVNVDMVSSDLMRQRLNHEIIRLKRDLERLHISDPPTELTLLNSYREMIHSRQSMLATMP